MRTVIESCLSFCVYQSTLFGEDKAKVVEAKNNKASF